MEFLRFGSSIPGEYWGCCACCIIQNFNQDPDTKASIQLIAGDGGGAMTKGRELAFAGPTLRDIFWRRIHIGTFGQNDMPNHAFLAIVTEYQASNTIGKKWLALLKEAGFEFLRTVDNSVYTGPTLVGGTPHPNHIFGLFRNMGDSRIKDPLTPPKAWTDLPSVVSESWESLPDREALAKKQTTQWESLWASMPNPPSLMESEVVAAGAPVILAGRRSMFPTQLKEEREREEKVLAEKGVKYTPKPGTNGGLYKAPGPILQPAALNNKF